MSRLTKLQSASTLTDLAIILGYQPNKLAYILYKIPLDKKYTVFPVSKKSGGVREIQAPVNRLKVLQANLSELLYDCCEEILPADERDAQKSKKAKKAISHGFKEGLSIASNAELHEGRRYVLNLDLSDFFPSINFGRVRGYFIKNYDFQLDPKVATIIAQIACYDSALPQGSPCSPVISNLVAQILDIRLVQLAKKYKCTYSRYADDLTFSTNLKEFPSELAFKKNDETSEWLIGNALSKQIERTGYKVNHSKTRMQYKDSRQIVTGLVVNKTVNIKSEYYRYARSMCNSLFTKGFFYLPEPNEESALPEIFQKIAEPVKAIKQADPNSKEVTKSQSNSELQEEKTKNLPSINKLEGILSFIFHIKKYRNKFANKGYRSSRTASKKYPPEDRCNQYGDKSHKVSIDGIRNLYSKFLFFKHFYFLERPLIWCEGKTDKVYLKCALRQLSKEYPELIDKTEEETKFKVKFFNHTKTVHEVMNLAEGSSGMSYMIHAYQRLMEKYKCSGKKHPVIMLIDNDDGANEIFSVLAQIHPNLRDKTSKKVDRTKPFYFVTDNLYLVPTPFIKPGQKTKIEDFFQKKILATDLEGKKFNAENTSSGSSNQYGKTVFAEKVVKPNEGSINFDGFKKILTPISQVLKDYDKRQKAA